MLNPTHERQIMSVIIVSPTRDYGVINSRRAGPGTAHSPPRPLVHVLQCASAGYLLFLRRLLQS